MVSIQCTTSDKKAFLITSLLDEFEFAYKMTDDEEETTSSNHQSSNNNPSSTSHQYGAGTESYLPNQDNSYGLSTLDPTLGAVFDTAVLHYLSNPHLATSASGWSANGEYPGSSGTYNSGLPSREPIYRSHSEPAYQTVSLPCPIGEIFNGLPP
jgi:hypothetical protein